MTLWCRGCLMHRCHLCIWSLFRPSTDLAKQTKVGPIDQLRYPQCLISTVLFNIKLHFYWGGHIVKWVLGKWEAAGSAPAGDTNSLWGCIWQKICKTKHGELPAVVMPPLIREQPNVARCSLTPVISGCVFLFPSTPNHFTRQQVTKHTSQPCFF